VTFSDHHGISDLDIEKLSLLHNKIGGVIGDASYAFDAMLSPVPTHRPAKASRGSSRWWMQGSPESGVGLALRKHPFTHITGSFFLDAFGLVAHHRQFVK
jgi:hypothetical protein